MSASCDVSTVYGFEDGRILGGGRNASLWWKDVCEVREGVGGVWGGGLRTILGGRWGAENHHFFGRIGG
jgi:hypothetical protein